MATMNVLDAAGATVAVEKPLTPGRAAAASSRPVALSTEDKAVLDALSTILGTTADAAAANGAAATLASYLRAMKDAATSTADSFVEAHTATACASLSPTIQTTIYTAGRVLFTPTPLPNAVRAADKGSVLTSLGLIDRSNQKPDLVLMFFKGNPSSFGAVNAAIGLNSADSTLYMHEVAIAAADWTTRNSIAYCTKDIASRLLIPAGGTSQVYVAGLLTGSGTPTYANATDFIINAGVVQG
jgi:hypothetical protein